jgi:ribA/ribD-fused uncharacterized protein
MPGIIKFYSPYNDHGYLSNFSLHSVKLEEKFWPTSEHYYQAMKSLDEDVQEQIRNAATPSKAKQLGKEIERRTDWESLVGTAELRSRFEDGWGCAVERVKDHFMMSVLIAKFEQHPDLRKALFETGDAILVEDAPKDFYWGSGATGTGQNKMGRILMVVRKHLRPLS